MSELVNIQRWFTSILVKPGRLDEKIVMADRHYRLDHAKLVSASEKLSPPERIGIYARGYFYRLLECMIAEFPAVQALIGEALFETFVRAYLVNRPPSSPDLYDLGSGFPAFLKALQSGRQLEAGSDPAMFDLPVEIAELERALAHASRCKGLEQLTDTLPRNDAFAWAFGAARYKASPALHLLKQQFALTELVRKAHREEALPELEKRETYVAICRKNYLVRMLETEAWQWYFLQSLQLSGEYNAAVKATAAQCNIAVDVLMADLLLWLPIAIEIGYIFCEQ